MTAEAEKTLKFAAASSDHHKLESAIENVCSEIEAKFAGQSPDFALLFISSPHIFQQRGQLSQFLTRLIERLGTDTVIGCSGSGVIGDGKEYEQEAAVSLFAASVPNAKIRSFYCNEIDRRRWKAAGEFAENLPLENDEHAPVFLLSDPFTFNIEDFLLESQKAFPETKIIGGLASGPGAPGLNVLFHGPDVKNNGAVGFQVEGDFDFRCVVSQGCRPIGRPGIITKGKGNVISSIRGRSPLEELEQLITESSEDEKELIQKSLLIGRVIDEHKHEFQRGDFLVRPIMKVSEAGMAIGDVIKTGQTVQFHARDAATAKEDLEQMLSELRDSESFAKAQGALLFACNGRGENLFGKPHHDSQEIQRILGDLAIGGFFCGGEIGPIGHKHFLHGFTSVIGVFAPRME